MAIENGLPWDHPDLRVGEDTPWRAGCRLLQSWWRQEALGLSTYGPLSKPKADGEPEPRLVGSVLQLDAAPVANFLDPIVLEEVELG